MIRTINIIKIIKETLKRIIRIYNKIIMIDSIIQVDNKIRI